MVLLQRRSGQTRERRRLATDEQGERVIMARPKSIDSTAYHEAGHAVLDVMFHHRFDAVYVFEESTYWPRFDGWYLGLVDCDQHAVYSRTENAISALAGPFAEARF